MKVKIMIVFLGCLLAALIGLQAYVRLAPTQSKNWVIEDTQKEPGNYPSAGGFMAVWLVEGDGSETKEKVDRALLALPRTQKVGQVQGQDVYVSRSLIWGFPDYITVALNTLAGMQQTRAVIFSRLRFGQSDMGVNQKRVKQVLTVFGHDTQG
jgi:uncharacterized protein (DUF1499 family)